MASLKRLLNDTICDSPLLGVAFYFKMTTKEQFLSEHNRLSPLDLQATIALLSRFRIDKTLLFKNDDWPIDKLRRPFILWLTSLPSREKENIKKEKIRTSRFAREP